MHKNGLQKPYKVLECPKSVIQHTTEPTESKKGPMEYKKGPTVYENGPKMSYSVIKRPIRSNRVQKGGTTGSKKGPIESLGSYKLL